MHSRMTCTVVQAIKFKRRPNRFQAKLAADIKQITKSTNLLIPADKTTNLYKMEVNDYKKLLTDNITSAYRKADASATVNINSEARSIAENLKIDDRIEQLAHKEAFITLQNHKPNFANSPECRLINAAKTNIGIISKHLDAINLSIRKKSSLQQWCSTKAVISWFDSLLEKNNCKFLKYGIVNFYPSICESLLIKALHFVSQFTEVSDKTKSIIWHGWKSLLFSRIAVWQKKADASFDVTMGSHDGTEICELDGLLLLHELSSLIPISDNGLYRDDRLLILRNLLGPKLETKYKD